MGTVSLNLIDLSRAKAAISLACEWTYSIGKKNQIAAALSNLATIVHAETASVVRKSQSSRRKMSVACYSRSFGKALPVSGLSVADDQLEDDLFFLRRGEMNFLSDLLDIGPSSLKEKIGSAEVAICILDKTDESLDFLELQFQTSLPVADIQFLQIEGPAFAESWARREPGSVRAMLDRQRLHVATQRKPECETHEILSVENPANLTRAEFRICALIQLGRLPDDLRAELGISQNTYRSHMRSIYLKTGTNGQLELVHLLHQQQSA